MNEKTKEKINTAFKKTVKAAKTKEGLGTIGGATVGGYIGSSIGIAALGTAVAGTLPVAAVGAGAGYAVTKLIRNRNKIKKLEKEVQGLKTPKVEKKDAEF